MRFQLAILSLAAIVFSVAAGPVPPHEFNAMADAKHTKLTEGRDECIHVRTFLLPSTKFNLAFPIRTGYLFSILHLSSYR